MLPPSDAASRRLTSQLLAEGQTRRRHGLLKEMLSCTAAEEERAGEKDSTGTGPSVSEARRQAGSGLGKASQRTSLRLLIGPMVPQKQTAYYIVCFLSSSL